MGENRSGEVRVIPANKLGIGFVAEEFLPAGCDEYYLRNQQSGKGAEAWRHLRSDEIETLVKNGNSCSNWDNVLVGDPFNARLIKNCKFSGLVRIGRLEEVFLEHHDLQVMVGLTNSLIISCDIGENASIHDVRYLSHYIVGDHVVLLNIDEMHTTDHAKFGNGIVKQGEPESVRVWMDVMNENGGRAVLPFDGMIPADAYLWAKYRDDGALQKSLCEITQRQFDARRGFYGTVGDASVVKNTSIVKDVKIGACAYIKGANKLKNLTINSTAEEPTQIGEGVEMVNGIVHAGCRVFYGCKAVRFVMGSHSALKYGARLIHSYLGENSTVSCCELLNNLIFPAHEQHHNNSFLTASVVLGQSNIAAGATVGSNHNSRSPDGEIQAGRGFWPGLCTTLKHFSRFASYALLVKGDYPAELNVTVPFALIDNDTAGDRLLILPAYWWLYNMYALARNTGKFQARDKRLVRQQHIEFDYLAPDTAEEMFAARAQIERWVGLAKVRAEGGDVAKASAEALASLGRAMLSDASQANAMDALEIVADGVENSRRKVVVIKARAGWQAYRQMLHYYAMKTLIEAISASAGDWRSVCRGLEGERERAWVNLGGQLAPAERVEAVLKGIREGKLGSWHEIHAAYDAMWAAYGEDKRRHAWATLKTLLEVASVDAVSDALWRKQLDEVVATQKFVCEQVYLTRKKDYENPFRQTTFRNADEMTAVMGTAETNSFVCDMREQTEQFVACVDGLRNR
jgi:NDP-sugar pyrophosphorylase family protein